MALTKDKINYLVILIISICIVLDLFLHKGQPITFDGPTHTATIAQFSEVLKSGDFPVVWADKYANYGYPIGLLVHQIPFYTGAVISFFTGNFIAAFNILLFLSVFLSGLFYYKFLRLYFTPIIALLGTVLFTFAPYRIINIYIRGAMPELFASIFVPLILIGIYNFVKKRSISSICSLIVLFTLLALTHPFLLIIELFIFIPYLIFVLLTSTDFHQKTQIITSVKIFFAFAAILVISLALASYYLMPLVLEAKYIVYSLSTSKSTYQFLNLTNFLDPNWYYFYHGDIFPRGHFIKTGVIEFVSIFLGIGAILYKLIFKKIKELSILEYAVISGLVLLLFLSSYSFIFYKYISILSEIQFPWRMLSAFIFIPPIIIAYICKDIKNNYLITAIMLLFALQYIPQLYGKNFTYYENKHYTSTITNLIGREQNTIWVGKTEDYPIKKQKYDIIGGKGKVVKSNVHNSTRAYQVEAQTPIRMVDYTFYFPGWRVYIDKQPVEIEYQDPNYRGVITYNVPSGKHSVELKFQDTKIRTLAKLLSFLTLISLPFALYFMKKNKYLESKAS
ncbi:MAG: 6-pyruvoyl-tetrahydropterin synthase-related protein [Patescibacteria group bacterium]